ncbi:MAG: gamma-glutamyltransferase, partial [Vicinamibacteria bacterium]
MIRHTLRATLASVLVLLVSTASFPSNAPIRAKNGMVISQNDIASKVGVDVMKEGGNAIDAAIATAFALAVTHPTAGNIGGGGFLVYRPRTGEPVAYDFREMAPAKATATMWLDEKGEYSYEKHHESHLAVGVPGTVAGLHLAWKENGSLPWERLVEPSIRLAREGFAVTDGLSQSLRGEWKRLKAYPATVAQFSKNGTPFAIGEVLKQPDLAGTLVRISEAGPAGFYEGETAELIEKEMMKNGGLIT